MQPMFTNRLCQRLAMSVCGIFLLFSCNKPAIEPNLVNQALEMPAVVDGKLEFSTLNSFGDYLKKNANPKTNIESNARKDFHSYNEIQHRHIAGRMEEQEIEEEDTTYIPDSNLASVLNKKREVTIGKLVYKFGSDYTFVYLPSDTALIHQFYQDLKRKAIEVPEKQLFIYKEKLSVAKTDQVLYEENKPISNGRIDASITKEDWFNNDEKVIAEVWSSSYFFILHVEPKHLVKKDTVKDFYGLRRTPGLTKMRHS